MKTIIKKILSLLTKQERKRLYMLIGVMTVSALLEVMSIVLIFPFLSLVADPSAIENNRIINWFYNSLNFQSPNRFLIFIGIVVLFILILSNILVLLTNWSLYRFCWMRNYTISKRLLARYLSQPYIFFLNQNTSSLSKNILSEVFIFITGVLFPLMQILSGAIVALFILAILIAADPVLAILVTIVLGGAYIFIYKMVKKKLQDIGEHRLKANTECYKVVDEAFGGIKVLKLLGREDFFTKSYSKPAAEFARHNTTNQIISIFPRYIMEIFAFGGIMGVILYLLATARSFQGVLPLVGLFAFAAYKLMPALQKIFASVATLRFSMPALDTIYESMHSVKEKSYTSSSYKKIFEPLHLKKELTLKEITFSYPGTTVPVIDNLTIKIGVNTSVAFVGETGVGKTTIADIMLSLLMPDRGRILVDAIEITEENLVHWQRNLGYIPQDIYLQDDTVTRNIAFGIPDDSIDLAVVENVAKIANIHNFIVEELRDGYQTIVGERGVRLSGGQRQRIGIARALYHDPGILVLDEATSALDGATEKEVFEAIHNIAQTKTLIIISHRLTVIKECDVIYVLKNGKIVGKGKYDELIETNEYFRKIANIKIKK